MHVCMYAALKYIPSTSYFSFLPQHFLYNNQNNNDVPHVNIPSRMVEHTIMLDGSLSENIYVHTYTNICIYAHNNYV